MVDNIYYLLVYKYHYILHELLLILHRAILSSQYQIFYNFFLYFKL